MRILISACLLGLYCRYDGKIVIMRLFGVWSSNMIGSGFPAVRSRRAACRRRVCRRNDAARGF